MANKNAKAAGDTIESLTDSYPEPREAQGLSSVQGATYPSATPERGTQIPKKHSKSVDPAMSATGRRSNVMYERTGAHYGVSVRVAAPLVNPEAGATQSNGRLFSHAIKRSAPNFRDGMTDHN
jgi:hypothetical protein